MNLYPKEDNNPNSIVVFYIACDVCDVVVIDYDEFYFGDTESNKTRCDQHTTETDHNKFILNSIVRAYICGDCGEEWTYKPSLQDWTILHHRASGHNFFGFSIITEDMYQHANKKLQLESTPDELGESIEGTSNES